MEISLDSAKIIQDEGIYIIPYQHSSLGKWGLI